MNADQGDPAKLVVLGLGNLISGDDGVGVVVVRELDRVCRAEDWPIEIIEAGVGGLGLLNLFDDAAAILAVDAAAMDLPPGSVRWITPGQLSQSPADAPGRFSLHDVEFVETLALAERFFTRPATIVYAIQPETLEPGAGLSRAVERRVVDMVDELTQALRNWADRAGGITSMLADTPVDRRDQRLGDWLRPSRCQSDHAVACVRCSIYPDV